MKYFFLFLAFALGLSAAFILKGSSYESKGWLVGQIVGWVLQISIAYGYWYYARKTYKLRQLLAKNGIEEAGI